MDDISSRRQHKGGRFVVTYPRAVSSDRISRLIFQISSARSCAASSFSASACKHARWGLGSVKTPMRHLAVCSVYSRIRTHSREDEKVGLYLHADNNLQHKKTQPCIRIFEFVPTKNLSFLLECSYTFATLHTRAHAQVLSTHTE